MNRARAVKLADKIANLRDVADSPPVKWSLARRQEYFDWAKEVVLRLPIGERFSARGHQRLPCVDQKGHLRHVQAEQPTA